MNGVTGLILAGGQGRRMGGVDKGLQVLRGRTFVEHVVDRLAPQVDTILVNANQNADRYGTLGHRVVPDEVGGFAGPLAGLHAGLKATRTPWLVTVPCDSPFLPHDLVARLEAGRAAVDADLAVAKTFDQPHPVFALVRTSVLDHLAAFLAGGGRKIDAWYATLRVVEVAFDDEADAFSNINTRDELLRAERTATGRDHGTGHAMNSLDQVIAGCLADYDPNALPVDDAKRVIANYVAPVAGVEQLAVRSSLGRVLATDVMATINVPAHDNSAMDGYAVRGVDLAGDAAARLRRIGEAFAGRPYVGAPIGPGECVRVMTGAVLPGGADTVVVQEITREADGIVTIPPGQKVGENVRFAGEDLAIGKPALRAGKLVRPSDLGLIASMGIGEVAVKRRVRVAFFSTGDELASIGQPLADGQVYDSNRYTLHGMLTRLGCEVIDLGVVRDDPAAIERALLDAAASADAIITSGGVSVVAVSLKKKLMARLGEVVFWTIAMRPGRPMAFGRIGNARFFGLPGNPVAVMVTFYGFVRDALMAMAGRTDDWRLPVLRVPCLNALRKKPGRTEYQRGILAPDDQGNWTVRLTGQQGSGVLRSMSEANCLIVLEHERGNVAAGDPVTVQVFEGLA